MSDLRTKAIRVAASLPQGDPTRRAILAAVGKEAGEVQHFWNIVDQKGYYKLRREMAKNDAQSMGLLSEVLLTLMKKLELTSNEVAALNRIQNSISRSGSWDISLQRNNIFKAANLLGIKLPSGMF